MNADEFVKHARVLESRAVMASASLEILEKLVREAEALPLTVFG